MFVTACAVLLLIEVRVLLVNWAGLGGHGLFTRLVTSNHADRLMRCRPHVVIEFGSLLCHIRRQESFFIGLPGEGPR